MLFSLFIFACGGPQETYIVPTGAQPKGLKPDSQNHSTQSLAENDELEADGLPDEDMPMGVDEGCGPTSNYVSKHTLTTENSSLITGTITGGVSESGPFLIDLIAIDGTQVYSIMCRKPQFEFRVPAENNVVRLAVFEDADQNGPSENDKQATSDILTLDNSPINGLTVILGEESVEGFNFSGLNNGILPPQENGDDESPPPGEELEFNRDDEENPAGDVLPGTEEAAQPPAEQDR